MKKSELRHIIKQVIKESLREQMNPFSNPPPGAGGGPNWDAAATAWDNWAASGGAPGTAPSPPQPFLDLGVKARLMYERLRARSEI